MSRRRIPDVTIPTNHRSLLSHVKVRARDLLLVLAVLAIAYTPARAQDDASQIHELLDDFHAAAAAADGERYLGHFSEDAVFMGTDDWERWPMEAFRTYVAERFEGGTGWTYVPQDRHLSFAASGDTVWFDELAVSPRWGRFRGTGVVVRTDRGWKVAHYSLTALVPNERFAEVSRVAQEGFSERRTTTGSGEEP